MTKIAKIEHDRCGEYEATTYVWVPDDMTADELQKYADLAHDASQTAQREFEQANPQPVYPNRFDWVNKLSKANPNMTIAEMEAEIKNAEESHKAWSEKRSHAREAFAIYLEQASGGRVKNFYSVELDIVGSVDWGHQHGQHIDCSGTNLEDFYPNLTEADKEHFL